MGIYETSTATPTVTYFLQQGHTYSNKPTPSNSAIPYELIGVNYIQMTTAPYTVFSAEEANGLLLDYNVVNPLTIYILILLSMLGI